MLSKDYRVPREINERDLVFDARPKTAVEAAEQAIQDMKEMPEAQWSFNQRHSGGRYWDARTGDEIEPPEPAKRSPVDRIAELMRDLTYGEMVELAGEIWATGNGEITAENLPQILWDWAVSP